jgi:hypothetical protein
MAKERDAKVSAAYRELGAEEPPRALDDAILAAARRTARPWTQRWALPLSLAAVVVLSVTVTLRVQHEQPGIEVPETARAPASLAKERALPEARIERQAEPQAKAESVRAKKEIKDGNVARNESVPFPGAARDQVQAPAEVASSVPAAPAARTVPTPPAAPAAASADSIAQQNKVEARRELDEGRERQTAERGASVAPAAAAPAPAVAAAKPALQGTLGESLAKRADQAALAPEKELERIAQLRRDGKHEEADKALAEFRKRHPDFKIPAPMLERVERR